MPVITGSAADSTLAGMAANDTLTGGGGADSLAGGSGNGLIFGGDTQGAYSATVSGIVAVFVRANGTFGNNSSGSPAFSPDGTRIVFSSAATNLLVGGGDTNAATDIFIKTLATGGVVRVSTSATGTQTGTGQSSFNPACSPDGTRVVFESDATGLVAGGTNGVRDIFLKDPLTGAISLVSEGACGVQANGSSSNAVFSTYGPWVAFQGDASNLLGGDTNGTSDLFLKPLDSGAVTLLSADFFGQQGNDLSEDVVFSADGTRAAFWSNAENLVVGDGNGKADVFVKDLLSGTVTRFSVTGNGGSSNGDSVDVVFSPDGLKVAFFSSASNLVSGDTNTKDDVFVASLSSNGVRVRIDGGAGIDTADFTGRSHAVTIGVPAGTVTEVGGAVDSIASIEIYRGPDAVLAFRGGSGGQTAIGAAAAGRMCWRGGAATTASTAAQASTGRSTAARSRSRQTAPAGR